MNQTDQILSGQVGAAAESGGSVRIDRNQLPAGLSPDTLKRIIELSMNEAAESRIESNKSTGEEPDYYMIAGQYAKYLDIFADIDRILNDKIKKEEPVLIAIDGPCASGKTTLGYLLKNVYDANLFHMDDYFLRPEQRTPQRLEEVGGNVDYERFKTEVLEPLKARRDFTYRRYDCRQQCLVPGIYVEVKPLNIIEGVYSRHPYFEEPYNLTYCLKVGTEEQQRRILERNGKDMLKRFLEEWIPKENRYLAMFNIDKEMKGNCL